MNRRYIADTTSLSRRTVVNAAFGTATAMGAALGPATAIMLDNVDFQFELPLYGTVYVNVMTGPGFLMGILWIIFTLVLALTFEEPERSGLQEQIRKEMLVSPVVAASSRATSLPPRSEYEMSNLDATQHVKNRQDGNDGSPSSATGQQKKDLSDSNNLDYVQYQSPSPLDDGQHHDLAEEAREAGILDSLGCPTEGGRDLCPALSIDCHSPDSIDEIDNIQDCQSFWQQAKFINKQITLPVRICMFLLFSKQFTVESVISAASMVTKNRYHWAVHQVGTLGTIVGCLTIPISVFIGWVSQYREDRVLMVWLMTCAAFGMGLLIDFSDFVSTDSDTYNEGNWLAVGPYRYIAGYLLVFCSVQAFDGVVGSVLSKVIPTALATGTLVSLSLH
jgi:hypothetical protein